MKKFLLLATALCLHGCGADEATFSYPDISDNELSYTYPYSGQAQVAPGAPFVARFSDPIKAFDASTMSAPEVDTALADLRADIAAQVSWLRASDDAPVSFSVQLIDNDASADGYNIDAFVLTPNATLQPATGYEVDLSQLQSDKGLVSVESGAISFTTRGDALGAKSTAITAADFVLEKMIPDGSEFPVADFSTLRLQFSHPLDADSVVYGTSLSLLDESDALVPARVLVNGVKLTIDPIDDLQPDTDYQLVIADNALFDRFGVALAGDSWTLTPVDTTPRSLLAQQSGVSNADPLLQCDKDAAGAIVSPLTGDSINCVPIKSVLLGDTTSSQTSGDLFAELAFVPNFPDTTPLRISRGTLLDGASVDVLVAGYVPMLIDTNDDGITDTPLATGDISVTFISDANGYLFANPYTDKADEPRHVRLLLDVAMTAETAEANGGLSQDLLHVEVVGTAIVIDGKMVIEAIGLVEPRVLGLDDALGVLSFHMETYVNNDEAPPAVVDTTMPTVQSWVPGDNTDGARPGDPVLVNFSEPVDPASIELAGALSFKRNGVDVPFDWRVDGATLVIQPDSPLEFSALGGAVTYTIGATGLITDLAGNPLDTDYSLDFALPVYEGAGTRAAFVTASYPGFPCAKTGTLNLASDQQARCLGGLNSDDILPVMPIPSNRPIQVDFSQNMDLSSFVLGSSCGAGTFRVEVVNNSGVCQSVVPGELTLTSRRLKFMPDTPWQEGSLYRYVITSQPSSSPSCGTNALCTEFGFPVQTALLEGNPANEGGPNMDIYFRGGAPISAVYQALGNLPTADVNADYEHTATEQQPQPDPANAGQFLTPPNGSKLDLISTGGLLLDANVGCGFVGKNPGDVFPFYEANPARQVCNDKKFVYANGALSADVIGWNEAEGGIEVHVYPATVMTTSADSYAVLSLVLVKEIDLIPTGPQIMRVRYADNGSGVRNQPVKGYIRDTVDGPMLSIVLDLYLDAPNLNPDALGIGLSHTLHSHQFSLSLSGPVTLLPDGRMNIEQVSTVSTAPILVNIGGGLASMTIQLPEGGVNLNYLSGPLKD